ncbi:hypothetical protein T265_04550 [Opisthorchis viverrini]|uniref:Oxysterol-binding protein n=1 Tax=Opisthorchis viverrini TaxID=6198 RepID=A0A074ZZJ2_OPIVI|nr:hypothetical protein T265_04550 [Opisthorchis viverrini]KER28680.1 hypothetical protein T265_04550 [Opisthorchis viverrini]
MDGAFTMEGPLSKWTNVVNGWQYRWFVLDFSVGILFYYTSKEKMVRGERRGCVKLKNAQVGIDDEDDSTFTITVDHKTFHFQARDANERQKWLDALQEARDLHTQNYALIHQTNRLLDHPSSLSEFDQRIVEADAYLQILIDQQQDLSLQNAETEECQPETVNAICDRLQGLIELVKKTIVCLQFARESMFASYSTVLTSHRKQAAQRLSTPGISSNSTAARSLSRSFRQRQATVEVGYEVNEFGSFKPGSWPKSPAALLHSQSAATAMDRSGQGAGDSVGHGLSAESTPSFVVRNSSEETRQSPNRVSDSERPASLTTVAVPEDNQPVPHLSTESVLSEYNGCAPNFLALSASKLPTSTASALYEESHSISMPAFSYSLSDDGSGYSAEDDEDEFYDTQEILCSGVNSPFLGKNNTAVQMSVNNQQDFSPADEHFDELYDDDRETDLGSVQSQGSVITHLLSQLRIGMDLTRITLPTFILERRSTLEMYADFLAHADLWAAIPDAPTAKERMVACLRWYLSAFHAGRRSSLAKKPYNPVLGEIFRCYWSLPTPSKSSTDKDSGLHKSGPVPWAEQNSVVFLAEQVSHHPPVSAFYAEHIGKRISLDGHLWTKSKFLGLSIAVEMVGSAVISLLNLDEEYVVTFPCGYGRNILTVPWIELGGKTSIICAKSGYVANIDFKTKPFYNGKKDLIRAEVLGPNERKPLIVVEGEWNNKMVAKWADGTTETFVDTKSIPVLRKQVLPRTAQSENESRRLWEQVTRNLKSGDIDAATDAKFRLEQKQRDLARHRQENKIQWIPEYFRGEGGNWIYRSPLVQRLADTSDRCNSNTTGLLPVVDGGRCFSNSSSGLELIDNIPLPHPTLLSEQLS